MAVDADAHPLYPAWKTPKVSALTKAMEVWIDYDDPQKTSQSIQSFSVVSIIYNHFLKLLKNI